jgi:putative nucleotidyltransferase with HDIG domain
MATAGRSPFSRRLQYYVAAVAISGAVAVTLSLIDLSVRLPEWRGQWLSLVMLTVVSGLLPVKLPTVNVSISISETFVIAGTLLFGVSGGTVLVLLDALFISIRLYWSRGLKWQQVIFNLAAPPLSIWLAASIAGVKPLYATDPVFGAWFVGQLTLFTTLYFLFNSWMLTFALALQQGVKARVLWWRHFRELLVNYGAGGSVAALLVYNTRTVDPYFVAATIPLLIVFFLTYQWSNRRLEAEREKIQELNRVFLSTIEALALAIDAKDQVTHGHIRRVQRYTMALAAALGVKDDKQLDALRAAALLHDTGKLAVPEYILNKPGPLTASEFERMKVHAAVGADILKSIDFPYPVEPIVRHHHESWDGTGYPAGLKGSDIPLGARILSVVDCYDALTSDRPYRPRYSREHAEQVLRERRGTMYDPWVVDRFLIILDELERTQGPELKRYPSDTSWASSIAPDQLEVISATTAEDREFNELRRELPKAGSALDAAEVLFRHVRRIVPAMSACFFAPSGDSGDLVPIASSGTAAAILQDLRIPIGERISGWALAHRQTVQNSNAALELGPVARTLAVPLRYVVSVPVLNAHSAPFGVVSFFGSDPFNNDHLRMLESAVTLFAAALAVLPARQTDRAQTSRESAGSGPRVH